MINSERYSKLKQYFKEREEEIINDLSIFVRFHP